jgi:HlyD family secretion protein
LPTPKEADRAATVVPVPPEIAGVPAAIDARAIATIPVAALVPVVKQEKRHWAKPILLMFVLLLAIIGGGYWWLHPRAGLPAGIASGNGRLEADEIDIDTKFAGRIAKLLADEGDLTKAGEVLALMDTQDLEASLKQSQALITQAEQTFQSANAALVQQKTLVRFAQQEIARTQALVGNGYATRETLDQRQQLLNSAIAVQSAAVDKIGAAQAALDAAKHAADVYKVNIADDSLVAPRDGRIEYRIANVGEVLPAGGKVFTMLDTAYVYMDIYLPTASAGRIKLGSDARIVLDAYPTLVLPASVTFVAAQAQFTPKTVETKDERDTLMFRIRARIDPAQLSTHAADVRSGLPGVTYVRTDPKVAWPATLQGTVPP